jgi:hypothetical protein
MRSPRSSLPPWRQIAALARHHRPIWTSLVSGLLAR